MSLKEAKEVTLSMAGKSFVPPPRHVDDILNVLDQKGHFDPKIVERMRKQAELSPPDTENSSALSRFYLIRGHRAIDFEGHTKQSLDDHRNALKYYEKAKKDGKRSLDDRQYERLLRRLSVSEISVGNLGKALALIKRSLDLYPGNHALKYRLLAQYNFSAGNLKAGEEATEKGLRICYNKLNMTILSELKREIYKRERALLLSQMLEMKGKYKEAEPYRREAVKLSDRHFRIQNRKGYWFFKRKLANNLAQQGKFAEAEVQMRQVLKETISLSGLASPETARTLTDFGRVLLREGRTADAEKLVLAAIGILETSGISHDSSWYYWARGSLGGINVAQHDFVKSLEQYDVVMDLAIKHKNQFIINWLERNPNFILALFETGRLDEAIKYISINIDRDNEHWEKSEYCIAEMIVLRDMAYLLMNKNSSDFRQLSPLILLLLKEKATQKDYLITQRLIAITENYLNLLTKFYKSSLDSVSLKAFEICGDMK